MQGISWLAENWLDSQRTLLDGVSKYIVYCTQRTILISFHIWTTFGNVINHYTKNTLQYKTKDLWVSAHFVSLAPNKLRVASHYRNDLTFDILHISCSLSNFNFMCLTITEFCNIKQLFLDLMHIKVCSFCQNCYKVWQTCICPNCFPVKMSSTCSVTSIPEALNHSINW